MKQKNSIENKGIVYLIGAGPGDPGLITVKGREILRKCDTVVYDHLASEALLSETRPGCRKIYVGKQAGHHSAKQEEINKLLVRLAEEGRKLSCRRNRKRKPFLPENRKGDFKHHCAEGFGGRTPYAGGNRGGKDCRTGFFLGREN